MRVLLDENVPSSVAGVFLEFGHEVLLVWDLLPVGSPNPLVAMAAEIEGFAEPLSEPQQNLVAMSRVPGGPTGSRGDVLH